MITIGILALLSIIAFVAWNYWDAKLVEQFSGQKWQVPAKVYARPLELYTGAPLSQSHVVAELKRLRYTQATSLPRAGTFTQSARGLQIYTRGFQFWDGAEPKQRVALQFGSKGIKQIYAMENTTIAHAVPIVRLEPVLIGGVYPKHREDRLLVKLEHTPKLLIQSLIYVEDRNFFRHLGISPKAILRAFWANLRSRRVRQGGSTLTQQLVKNYFLQSERTLSRKIVEATMALILEYRFNKDEILEAYLNEVYLGQAGSRAIHGFGLAAHHYFGIPLEDLSLAQHALLVALVKGPSYYDPRRHPDRAMRRRNLVINVLLSENIIDAEQAELAQSEPLTVLSKTNSAVNRYPAFMDLVQQQLKEDYPKEALQSKGLVIFTTLDTKVQNTAEKSIQKKLATLAQRNLDQAGDLQSAMVITEPQTGEVLAVVGGSAVKATGFNRALQAKRPVGSILKPIVYLAALEQDKYQLNTPINDDIFSMKLHNGDLWQPKNFDLISHGEVFLQEALIHSYNQATARLGDTIGPDAIADMIERLGVKTHIPKVPALALGAIDLSPFEVAQLYQTIAAQGFQSPLRAIRAVLKSDGDPLQRYPLKVQQAVDHVPIFLLKHALTQVTQRGTAKSIRRHFGPSYIFAGKTGTTNDLKDSWFAGMSEEFVVVIWVGYDDNRPTGLTGASGALQTWITTMKALRPTSIQNPLPPGFEWVWLDTESKLRVNRRCPDNAVIIPLQAERIPQGITSCDWNRLKEHPKHHKRGKRRFFLR